MDLPDIEGKSVLVIGCPASGKTWIIDLFNSAKHTVIHTDDYAKHGFAESMYVCLKDILKSKKPTIVEGVQGYRLLRKGVELNNYFPDIVIELKITEERMFKTYADERNPRKIKYLKGFKKAQNKILNDYKIMVNDNKPEWITIDNDY